MANVSDSARWVAAYRAVESARPDAVFRDQYADRLAGPQGRMIARAAPHSKRSGWSVVARTKVIDDLVMLALGEGCDRVLNLAAGFDTRPYRLDLPPELVWIEADLPALLEDKEQLLDGETARCTVTRYAVDLVDPQARRVFLDAALAGASKALVLTEGLVGYLDQSEVVALSDAFRRPEIAWWTVDIVNPRIVADMVKKSNAELQRAPFAPIDGVGFFEARGWRVLEVESVYHAARRLRRLPLTRRLYAYLPGRRPTPRNPGGRPWMMIARLSPAGADT
ncbi:class I SAM-dependent methyltransferase [Nocardia asteroides]|uniref:class I SAM-dependent methyltransferase n=1 Tax=Nocardia asteroides TaxID=1824 RepID=UPI001E3A7085|nr:SAM-dependent methyltransferase [Nocardia asteroides]UGT61028.1 SAM-dependent methyltransferase [Nocardia asteroides]